MPVTIVKPEDRDLSASDPKQSRAPTSVSTNTRFRVLSEDQPYVHIVQTKRNVTIPLHSHTAPEVTIVLEGNVKVGGELCPPGTVLIIPANAEYDLEIQDEDLTFVVVRPSRGRYQESNAG